MAKHDANLDMPTPDQVRAALDSIVSSDVLRSSPQLVAFLRFIVEEVLSGKGDRIKSYTIGVEVLRRPEDFDPQIDPIVRVEATRLRRALERYYTGPGIADDVTIVLQRGSYIPTFKRRPEALDDPEVIGTPNWLARRPIQFAAICVVGALALASWLFFASRQNAALQMTTAAVGSPPLRPGNGLPVLFIQPFTVNGHQGLKSISAASLYFRLADAFSLFDLINIRWLPDEPTAKPRNDGLTNPLESQSDYRLFSSIDYNTEGASRLRFQLLDSTDNLVWSKTIDRISDPDRNAAEDQIAGELAETLVQPFGVIYSDGRNKSIRNNRGDPRYRCVIEAIDSFRSFSKVQHANARSCLEKLTTEDPSFGVGFTYLAAMDLREYQYKLNIERGGLSPLDRALRAARRGIEVNPESSRAYELLFAVLFAKHDMSAAFAAGEKAMKLNRYDKRTIGAFGSRLIANGDIDRGLNMLAQAENDGRIIPAFEQFFLFLGYYMRGDMARAAFHSGQLVGSTFPLGLIARAVTAAARGDHDTARKDIDQLVALDPSWRDDLQGNLDRFFPSKEIVDRLTHALDAAGLKKNPSGTSSD